MTSFIQLTENDKRLIIVLLLVLILAFVIIGYLSLFVKKIMQFQAKKADDMLADVYNTGVCNTEKKLRRYGIRKNWRVFFSQATIPFIILATAWLLFFIFRILIINEPVKIEYIFGWEELTASNGIKVTGFGSLFYQFAWNNRDSVETFLGITVYARPEVIQPPTFRWSGWFSYLFVPANVVGIVWLLVCVQAYIARSFRVFKLSATLFKKTLDKKPMPLDQQTTNQLTNNQ